MDQGAMAMKGYSTFPKAPAELEPHHQIVLCHIRTLVGRWGSYLSTEVQLVYSTAPADWANYAQVLTFDILNVASMSKKNIRVYLIKAKL